MVESANEFAAICDKEITEPFISKVVEEHGSVYLEYCHFKPFNDDGAELMEQRLSLRMTNFYNEFLDAHEIYNRANNY